MRSASLMALVLLLVLVGACAPPPPADQRPGAEQDPGPSSVEDDADPTDADPTDADPTDADPTDADPTETDDADPLAAWVTDAEEALGRPEVDAPTFFYLSMHPDARPAFRSCDTSWLAEAGIRWDVRYRVEADPSASESAPWVGSSGPLAERSFPRARELRLRLTDPQGELSAAVVPYVVEDGQLWWLADCPEPG